MRRILIPIAVFGMVSMSAFGEDAKKPVVTKEPTKVAAPKEEKAKAVPPVKDAASAAGPKVEMKTNKGKIVIELNKDKAPISTANFIKYVEAKHYHNTVFHRVISDFMIQGGGFKVAAGTLEESESGEPIKNESTNGLSNARGTLAMARTNDPDSATAQFYINVKDNAFLDSQGGRPGYAVFGKVIEGMDIVDKIKDTATGKKVVKTRNGKTLSDAPFTDVPVENVVIESMTMMK